MDTAYILYTYIHSGTQTHESINKQNGNYQCEEKTKNNIK